MNRQSPEAGVGPEERERSERMRRIACNMIDSLAFDPNKETFLLVTDNKVIEENKALVDALQEELESRTSQQNKTKGNYKIIVAKSSEKSATPFGTTIGRQMKDRPVLILTSMSRSHSSETGAASRGEIRPKQNFISVLEDMQAKGRKMAGGKEPQELLTEDKFYQRLQELARQTRARIMSCTKGTNPFEILTKGAVEEDNRLLKERAEEVRELMQDVVDVRITTDDGTDLILRPRVDKDEIETGDLSKPGSLSNYPVGEWACAVWWEGACGVMVVDGPFGGKNTNTGRWHNLDWVKEAGSFELTIREGEVTAINGRKVEEQRRNPENDLVASFIAYLDSGNNEYNHAYKLAEFAVGVNSKACQGKPDEHWGSTETEKKYGTTHIAVGSNGSFGIERDDPNFDAATIHCDMVILDHGLTIECNRSDGSRFYLIEKGQAVGY